MPQKPKHLADRFSPPLNDKLLRGRNFFELYPFDGGGALVHHDLLGTLDDQKITNKILLRGALKNWGKIPNLDFAALERWRTGEKSCWLNRCYFLASLARQYRLAGDERIARRVTDTILYFIRHYPPPTGKKEIGDHIRHVYYIRDNGYNVQTHEENLRDETDIKYVWFDFQPASRLLHFIYAFHFLRGSKSVSAEELAEIKRGLYAHGELILAGERFFNPLVKGNHQSLRGLALLLVGAFFRGFGKWKSFVKEGLRICNFHIRNDFMPDGALAENSPSYHCFETWHIRDAILLSNRYGFALCKSAETRLKNAVAFIEAMCQPDGYSPVINDGYSVHLQPFLETMPTGPREGKNSPQATFFKDAGLAFYKDRQHYLAFDASPFTGQFSHYHAGKNAVTYWYKDKPFLVDSGCCNYEDKLFATWYKRGEAHTSLLVNGRGDGTVGGTYDWKDWAEPHCGGWTKQRQAHAISSKLTSSSAGWKGVSWNRKLEVPPEEEVIITDEVFTRGAKALCFVFNLHPAVKVNSQGKTLILKHGHVRLRFDAKVQTGQKAKITLAQGKCSIDFTHKKTCRILVEAQARGRLVLETRLTPL